MITRIARFYPQAAMAAAPPLLIWAILAAEPYRPLLNTLATMACISGLMLLMGRRLSRELRAASTETREQITRILRQVEELNDELLLIVGAAVVESLRAHVEPDSPWRLNLIKEIADYINDGNAITLSALEGGVHDLSERLATLERGWRMQRGQ